MVEILEFSEADTDSETDDRLFVTLKVDDPSSVNLNDIIEVRDTPYQITGIGMVPSQAYDDGIVLVSAEPLPLPDSSDESDD